MKLKTYELMSRSEMNVNSSSQFYEIEECSLNDKKDSRAKYSFNQQTQKFLSNISKLGIPQIFRKSPNNKNARNDDSVVIKRPVSMYIKNESTENSSTLDQYMHDSTILMALRDTEAQLMESGRHKLQLESRIESLEKEISNLLEENNQYLCRERVLQCQVRELERRYQSKEAEMKEHSLNARIREIELLSEIATLSQKLSNIDTKRQELKIQKIMECQSRIVEQTLPYTASVENIYDNEDGLFNANLFDEILKEQSQNLDNGAIYRKVSARQSEDDNSFLMKDSEIVLPNCY